MKDMPFMCADTFRENDGVIFPILHFSLAAYALSFASLVHAAADSEKCKESLLRKHPAQSGRSIVALLRFHSQCSFRFPPPPFPFPPLAGSGLRRQQSRSTRFQSKGFHPFNASQDICLLYGYRLDDNLFYLKIVCQTFFFGAHHPGKGVPFLLQFRNKVAKAPVPVLGREHGFQDGRSCPGIP